LRTQDSSVPSYTMIGRWFGKDHTTIMHGVRRWQEHADRHARQMQREAA
jgi:chromosomal replication initiation ATPase DnaA